MFHICSLSRCFRRRCHVLCHHPRSPVQLSWRNPVQKPPVPGRQSLRRDSRVSVNHHYSLGWKACFCQMSGMNLTSPMNFTHVVIELSSSLPFVSSRNKLQQSRPFCHPLLKSIGLLVSSISLGFPTLLLQPFRVQGLNKSSKALGIASSVAVAMTALTRTQRIAE